MLGTLLATRYKIIRILGTGGFGQTYIAEDTQRPSPLICVVKHLRPNNQDADFLKVARRLFDTEVETLRRLGQHEQIPALLDSFEEDGEFYFVQEYIDGFPLSEEISGRFQLSEDQVIAVLDDVLQVLDFVHANNVIHRDIKPGNLIRRRDGKLVLIDFGAVKEIQTQLTTAPTGTSSGQTGFTVGIGTQGYTPSEQLAGRPRYSSDLYALGVTAIQMLTGLMPHEIAEHPHTGELMWEDYANASPGLKLLLSKMIRQHVAYRYAAASEVQRDLQRLDELPADSSFRQPHDLTRLPDLETRQQRLSAGIKAIALASVATLCLCLGIRQIGGFEPLEVRAFDQMMRSRPDLPPDSRLLVVEITEADLRQLGRPTPSDQTIAEVIDTLQQHNPRVIGVDLYRELPQEPGHAALMQQFTASNVMTIANIGDETDDLAIPPPESVPPHRVGFNDVPLDDDGVVRRNLLFATVQNQTLYSFALRVALQYLDGEDIQPQNYAENPDYLQLDDVVLAPITSNAGGYRHVDARGYQLLLNYRSSEQPALQVTLSEILSGQFEPEWIQDKIVVIGTTASSAKDLFYTPYSAGRQSSVQMPGVIIHTHMISQILSAVLDERPQFSFWPEWAEVGWIVFWTVMGGSAAWFLHRPIVLILGGTGMVMLIVGTSVVLFTQSVWIPISSPIAACAIAAILVLAYRIYRTHRTEEMLATALTTIPPDPNPQDALRS
jgi:CHASE2 domain-containing sensor protein